MHQSRALDTRLRSDTETFAYGACALLLLATTLLQKFALPGTGSALPITLLVLSVVAGVALVRGALAISVPVLLSYCLFAIIAILSYLLSRSFVTSLSSLILVAVVQAHFMLRVNGSEDDRRLLHFARNLALFLAVVGIAQFFGQFYVGTPNAFFIDHYVPEAYLLAGYNALNPLMWGTSILKSNGVFFAEPSYFSQFMAIGILTELLVGPSIVRLAILGLAMIVSFSGTGMLMVMAFGLFFARERVGLVIIAGMVGAALLYLFADLLHLDILFRRASEFSEESSSAYARFFSMFPILRDVLLNDAVALLFGRGPGTVQEFFDIYPNSFDPTWSKILYEYGLLGAAAYGLFFTQSVLLSRQPLRYPLAFMYFFLGGFLVDASVVIQLLVLAVWIDSRPADLHRGDGR